MRSVTIQPPRARRTLTELLLNGAFTPHGGRRGCDPRLAMLRYPVADETNRVHNDAVLDAGEWLIRHRHN